MVMIVSALSPAGVAVKKKKKALDLDRKNENKNEWSFCSMAR